MPERGLPIPAGQSGLCDIKLPRCCGEGPLRCAKEPGHAGPHEDEGVIW